MNNRDMFYQNLNQGYQKLENTQTNNNENIYMI